MFLPFFIVKVCFEQLIRFKLDSRVAPDCVLSEKVFLEISQFNKETLTQVFSCGFCEISEKPF